MSIFIWVTSLYHIMILSFLFSIVLHSKLSRIVLFTVILYIYGTYFIWLQHVPQIIQHVFLSIEKRLKKNWFDHEVHCSKVPFKNRQSSFSINKKPKIIKQYLYMTVLRLIFTQLNWILAEERKISIVRVVSIG